LWTALGTETASKAYFRVTPTQSLSFISSFQKI
jgi:hypothetical protein